VIGVTEINLSQSDIGERQSIVIAKIHRLVHETNVEDLLLWAMALEGVAAVYRGKAAALPRNTLK
jgi:hypothetical protein